MKAYRIKHIPIGLYYQPSNCGNNLSEHGKVYLTKLNPLSMNRGCNYIRIDLNTNSKVYQTYKESLLELKECSYKRGLMQGRVPKEKFKIEYINEDSNRSTE